MKKVSQLFTTSKEDQKVTWFEDSDHIQFVDYTDEHKREEYRRDGTLATVSYFHSDSENPYLIEYINKDNLVYLDKIFTTNNETEESVLMKINWYSDQGLQSFSRETDLRQFWIKQIQKASTEPKLFLIDSRPQDRHILNVPKEKNSYYAAVAHSKHYGANKFTLKKRFEVLLSNRLKLDGVFFLTKEQIEDVELITGPEERFFYTPHTLGKNPDESVLHTERTSHRAVIISRLTSSKNMEDTLLAFQHVLKKIPDATLDLFGSGTEEEKIKSLITELDLEQKVFMRGYTKDPDHEFQKAALTICTSKFEGFGLSNMEALSNGCPVVTYDYDYGARTLVKDGENGFIVQQGDIEALAERIIKIMNDDELRQRISETAYHSAKSFSPEAFITYWGESLQQMVKLAQNKNKLTETFQDYVFTLTDMLKQKDELEFILEAKPLTLNEQVYSINIVGLDRKHSIQLLSMPLTEQQPGEFKANISTLKREAIEENDIKTIDFYVQIVDKTGASIYKRLASRHKTHESIFLADLNLTPYQTKLQNYSWTI